MTVRIKDPKLDKTGQLLYQVMQVVLKDQQRVQFECPAGEAKDLVQRLRMQLSRQRTKMRQRGKRIREFQLYSTIHTETHAGVRYDSIVMWVVMAKWQQAELEIEKMLSGEEVA